MNGLEELSRLAALDKKLLSPVVIPVLLLALLMLVTR